VAKGSLFRRFSPELAIDLGTSNTLVYVKGEGIVVDEPSALAVRLNGKGSRELIAVGAQAKEMLGRTPASVTVIQPLRHGVIADIDATEEMIRHFVAKVTGRLRLRRPRAVICVPSGSTPLDMRALREAAETAGIREPCLVPEALAAAIGSDLPVAEAKGSMIVDIGGGTAEIAVVSLSTVVAGRSVRAGGNRLDESIASHVRRIHNLRIGERTAELIKIILGSAYPDDEVRMLEVKGRDVGGRTMKSVEISGEEIREALMAPLQEVVDTVHSVLQETPPELVSDIAESGVVLSGGGALLRNLPQFFQQAICLPQRIADNPLRAVVNGATKLLDDPSHLGRAMITSSAAFEAA
jgi:rod shape-determining protein MreB